MPERCRGAALSFAVFLTWQRSKDKDGKSIHEATMPAAPPLTSRKLE
jgi:hypothetical protein